MLSGIQIFPSLNGAIDGSKGFRASKNMQAKRSRND
jgi:hypothetical protein